MKPVFALVLFATLAACGADGKPEAPAAQSASEAGITVTGCVKAGVTFGAPAPEGPDRC